MATELKNRERKVDINTMSPEQADAISEQLGSKIREICDEAVEKANKFLNVYGMQAKMQIVIDHPDMVLKETPKKRKTRTKKGPQSLS